MLKSIKRAEQNNSANTKIKIAGFPRSVRMVRESAVSLYSDFCCTGGNSYYAPINRLAKTMLIAIFFAMSFNANLNAQVQITFTSPDNTLTWAQVNQQLDAYEIAHPNVIAANGFTAVIDDNITEIGDWAFMGVGPNPGSGNATNSDFLVGIIAPGVKTIGMRACSYCISLVNVSFPEVETIVNTKKIKNKFIL